MNKLYSIDGNKMVKQLVRINPKSRSGHGKHFGRAMLISVSNDIATVLPFGRHRQFEKIPLRYIKGWTSKNEIALSRGN